MKFFLDEINQQGFNWKKAASCAQASELAYSDASVIERVCVNRWKFNRCKFIDVGLTQLFVADSDFAMLVAFRGSSDLADWMVTNLEIPTQPRPYGNVHGGFLRAYQDIENDLRQVLREFRAESKTVSFTGHSLGGALASIARLELYQHSAPTNDVSIFTFGQPRTGDEQYATSINEAAGSNYFRFVFDEDLVTRIPPHLKHGGTLRKIYSRGLLASNSNPTIETAGGGDADLEPLSDEEFRSLLEAARNETGSGPASKRSMATEGVFGSALEAIFPAIGDHRIAGYIQSIRRIARREEKVNAKISSSVIMERSLKSDIGMTEQLESVRARVSQKMPLLIRVNSEWQADGFKIDSRFGDIVSLMADEDELRMLESDPNVDRIEGSREGGMRECATSIPFVKANVAHELNEKGEECLVGIIDTGIDVLHKAFREIDDDAKCRILGVWDQHNAAGPTPKEVNAEFEQDYGTYYPADQIQSFVDGPEPTPLALRDRQLHGTHVASIAAGKPTGNFAGGVAPASGIIVVMPSLITIPGAPRSLGYSKSHVDALHFLKKAAHLNDKPIAINVSLGMNAGPHDGTSLLEASFDAATTNGHDRGIVIVKSAGNEGGRKGHASVNASQVGQREIQWNSSNVTREEDYIECWYSFRDELQFTLVMPGGNALGTVDNTNQMVQGEVNGNVFLLNLEPEHDDNGDSMLSVTIRRGSQPIQAGTWTLKVVGQSVNTESGRVDAWIERYNSRALEFTVEDPNMTLSVPGTADTVITVSGCRSTNPLEMATRSSMGLTRDGRTKPDICAPGEGIVAARANEDTHEGTRADTGTSFAAPHVTGAMSLAMSKRQRDAPGDQLNARKLRTHLVRSCNNMSHNDGYGFGVLNVEEFLNRI